MLRYQAHSDISENFWHKPAMIPGEKVCGCDTFYSNWPKIRWAHELGDFIGLIHIEVQKKGSCLRSLETSTDPPELSILMRKTGSFPTRRLYPSHKRDDQEEHSSKSTVPNRIYRVLQYTENKFCGLKAHMCRPKSVQGWDAETCDISIRGPKIPDSDLLRFFLFQPFVSQQRAPAPLMS